MMDVVEEHSDEEFRASLKEINRKYGEVLKKFAGTEAQMLPCPICQVEVDEGAFISHVKRCHKAQVMVVVSREQEHYCDIALACCTNSRQGDPPCGGCAPCRIAYLIKNRETKSF